MNVLYITMFTLYVRYIVEPTIHYPDFKVDSSNNPGN